MHAFLFALTSGNYLDMSSAATNVEAFLTDNGGTLATLVGVFIVVRKAPSLVRKFAR